jgi:pilus assembly protein CpaB
MKTPRALLFAIIAGALAAISLYLYISGRENFWNSKYGKVQVLSAKVDIQKYQMINEAMLDSKAIPREFMEPDALTIEDAGKVVAYMADVTIKKGSQITYAKVSPPGGGQASVLIEKDERACTISVNDVTGVGSLIRPQDRIDILGTFKADDKGGKQTEVVTLFQNVRVLAVGRNYMFEASPISGKEKGLGSLASAGTSFSNVTVVMTPRQCMDLTVAQQVGVLTLTLRSYLNREGGKTFPDLRDQHSTTASATGIKGAIDNSNKPKWLELRGEHSTLVP